MGLFSSKTKVYVSSSVWNLAGEAGKRAELLPSLVISSILTRQKGSLSDFIQGNLRSSTALRSLQFFRWATSKYSLGMPTGALGAARSVASANIGTTLRTVLGLSSNQAIRLHAAQLDDPEVEYWAEHWITQNHPGLGDEDWSADYDTLTSEITIAIGEDIRRIPAPADLLWGLEVEGRKLLYVGYQILTKNAQGLWNESPQRLYTYRMGSGTTAFDQLAHTLVPMAEFLPAIPLRLHNESVREIGGDLLIDVETAFKKLTGAKLSSVLDEIEDHEKIDDMDHIMVVPAVSLNSKDAAAQAYLYAFFRSLIPRQMERVSAEDHIESQFSGAASEASWSRWVIGNGSERGSIRNPSHGADLPNQDAVYRRNSERNEIRIHMPELEEYDFRILWHDITETQHVGNGRAVSGPTPQRAKKGDYWFEILPDITFERSSTADERNAIANMMGRFLSYSRIAIYHQYGPRRYRKLVISGLQHKNYVYGNKSVTIDAREAAEDTEESGFLVPLHMPTFKTLSLYDRARLAPSSCYMVVNAYKKVKVRWWQRGFFKIILAAISIAISIVSAGAGLGATVGLLGTNAAVGISLGASVAMAAMVGAIANGIAAVVLTSILSRLSVEVFGEKWGAIIGTIASFVGMQVGMNFAATGSFNVNWGALLRIENLMGLTNSLSGAYSQFLAADTAEIVAQMEELSEEHKDAMDEIKKLAEENLGMTKGSFDPMMLTDASEYFAEPPEVFLGRTLLTGSDLVEMSHALVEDFAALSLELPRAL